MNFKDKHIVVMGLGLLGRGVGDVEFLLDKGAKVTVTDLKSEEELRSSIEKLLTHPNAKNLSFSLKKHDAAILKNADMLIKGAGVPLDSEFVNSAHKMGVKVTMSTALFAKLAQEKGVTLVGVTGTKGKSTVTHMIYHALQLSTQFESRVHIGGNVKGISTLALLDRVKKGDVVVLELDSWQLQGFGYEKVSPQVAVFTNFFEDHLNYYPDMEFYFKDKAQIYLYQKLIRGDILFVGKGVPKKYLQKFPPPTDPIEAGYLPEDYALQVLGEHNRENASFAREALMQLGVPEDEIRIGLESFKGVPGRLYMLGEYEGEYGKVTIFDDNNSTTPSSTLASIKAILTAFPDKELVVILGGSHKNLDLNELASFLSTHTIKTILLPGSGSEALYKSVGADNKFIMQADNLSDAVKKAEKITDALGDSVLLFSPGFASFQEFSNEYERDKKFIELVESNFAPQSVK